MPAEYTQRKKNVRFYLLLAILVTAALAYGCARNGAQSEGESLEFTVVAEEDLPAELKTIIDEKKTGEFRLTYTDGEFLYIAVGYGKQQTGGYSIQIPRVSLNGGNIIFESRLLGPEGAPQANISYPYAVIKTENRKEPVLFQ